MPPVPVRRRLLQGLGLLLLLGALGASPPLRAEPVELAQLDLARSDGALTLEFAARVTLPRAVEEALHRGVPVYFVAQADLKRKRWYWRDERVARVTRSWRVAYQPLTNTWRVSLGGLHQSYPSLADAMATVSRSGGWRIAELAQLDADSRYELEFIYKLDTAQLPSFMQIGLGGPNEWAIGAERVLRLDADKP
ncbi:DUF4390 domain-containing protein [Rubrivivax sp. RP6-9]|uniref:DUF4390 domain-containing protein n=1 Tax=Rubrivivax sp. RP6-9 TaxID=3415750 RepID=UPI003CC6DD0A